MNRRWLVSLGLVILTGITYAQTLRFGVIHFDDYPGRNEWVHGGLCPSSMKWALTGTYEGTWQPLVWLSYMAEYQMAGPSPWIYHLTNLLLHTTNTVVLFLLLTRMTRSPGSSAFVAILFALHPLHVESVAWIAERKDLLSTLFLLLGIWAYLRYTEHPGVRAYLLVTLFFLLGLTAKPMILTFPLLLLVLDYWPLHRPGCPEKSVQARLVEKVPLFIITAIFTVVFFLVQRSGGAVSPLGACPLWARSANAVVSYVDYIGKCLWPAGLSAFYPHPGTTISLVQVGVSGIFLLCISALVARYTTRYRYLGAGWCWYLISLFPVIGWVQFGGQAMADRFSYVPLIGLFVMAAWGVPDLLRGREPEAAATATAPRRTRMMLVALFAGTIAVILPCSYRQTSLWKDDLTLFGHARDVTIDNYMAEYMIGGALVEEGKVDAGLPHLFEAVRIHPGFADSYQILGKGFTSKGDYAKAADFYSQGLRLDSGNWEIRNSLGCAFIHLGRYNEAAKLFEHVLTLRPADVTVRYNLAIALYRQRDYAGCWTQQRHCRRYGTTLPPAFLKLLARKMPEPPK